MSGPGDFKPFDSGVTPRFQEIATFMRSQRHEISPAVDIALAGVPFDLGATYRVGARHGPAVTREASRLIRAVNPATRVAPFRLCNIGDVGDAPTHPMLIDVSMEKMTSVGDVFDECEGEVDQALLNKLRVGHYKADTL